MAYQQFSNAALTLIKTRLANIKFAAMTTQQKVVELNRHPVTIKGRLGSMSRQDAKTLFMRRGKWAAVLAKLAQSAQADVNTLFTDPDFATWNLSDTIYGAAIDRLIAAGALVAADKTALITQAKRDTTELSDMETLFGRNAPLATAELVAAAEALK